MTHALRRQYLGILYVLGCPLSVPFMSVLTIYLYTQAHAHFVPALIIQIS